MKYKIFAVFSSLLLLSCFLLIPVSAAETSDLRYNGFSFPEIPSYEGVSAVYVDAVSNQASMLIQFPSDSFVELNGLSVRLSSSGSIDVYVLVSGVWVFAASDPFFALSDGYFLWASSDILNSSGYVYFPGSDPFTLSPEDTSPVLGDGLYFQAYELLADHVFGLELSEMTSSQELMVSLLAGLAVAFLIILPFILVWRVIRIFF